MRWSLPVLGFVVVIGLVGCGNPPTPTNILIEPEKPTVPVRPPTNPEPTPITEPKFEPLPGKDYVVNSIGLRLVKIPAGKFIMGSPRDEKDRQDVETPQHEVTISKPFQLGVFAVTQEEYEKVMKTNPSWFSVGGQGEMAVKGLNTRRFPVEMVSWDDAVEFCKKLSALLDEQKAGRVYRLPTEAEWEYACRAGTTTPFHFGKECNGKQANCDGTDPYGTEEKGPSLERPCPVGSYAPNAFGLYDMHGNVWQWCEDWFGASSELAVTDPKGPRNGSVGRVLRGGSWHDSPAHCRAALRYRGAAGTHLYRIGFRIALRLD